MISPIPITPPKTGSTSLVQALLKQNYILPYKCNTELTNTQYDLLEYAHADITAHYTFLDLMEKFNVQSNKDIVLTVRNPYTRLASIMNFVCRYKNMPKTYRTLCLMLKNDFLKSMLVDHDRWIAGCEGNISYIKFEQYHEDIQKIYKFDINSFFCYNKSNLSEHDFLEYFDDNMIKLTNELFSQFFEKCIYTMYNSIDEAKYNF